MTIGRQPEWKWHSDLSSPVVGLHSVGCLTSGQFCWVCLSTGEFLRPQGAIPPGFYPLQGGYCLAPQKGECRQARRYFWPCWTRVNFGPATGPTLKTALCHIRALVGHMINNQNESDTHLDQIGWIFVRESNEMNIVIKRTRLCHEKGKWVLSAFVYWRTRETSHSDLFITFYYIAACI